MRKKRGKIKKIKSAKSIRHWLIFGLLALIVLAAGIFVLQERAITGNAIREKITGYSIFDNIKSLFGDEKSA